MFSENFRKLLALTRHQGGRFALLFIDLNRFKQMNDTLGHDAGDALVVEAAARLRDMLRESDSVSRLGGDEFAILLAETLDLADVELVAGGSSRVSSPQRTRRVILAASISVLIADGPASELLGKSQSGVSSANE